MLKDEGLKTLFFISSKGGSIPNILRHQKYCFRSFGSNTLMFLLIPPRLELFEVDLPWGAPIYPVPSSIIGFCIILKISKCSIHPDLTHYIHSQIHHKHRTLLFYLNPSESFY
jgi:hypothetical protein